MTATRSTVQIRSVELETAMVQGDALLLEQCIDNLIENAILHNVAGGWVDLAVAVVERYPQLGIENSGPLLSEERVTSLFAPFQRDLNVQLPQSNGHGLGLSVVRSVVQAHDARMVARPRREGGLAVEIRFPPTLQA